MIEWCVANYLFYNGVFMLTFKQLAEAGAQLVAGRVILNGQFVEGIVHENGFEPAPGTELFVPAVAEKPAAKKRVADKPAE